MKKILLVFVIIVSFMLIGCESADDVFEKNIKCQKEIKKVKEHLREKTYGLTSMSYRNRQGKREDKMIAMFYSSKKKTCLFSSFEYKLEKYNTGSLEDSYVKLIRTYRLVDAFTYKVLEKEVLEKIASVKNTVEKDIKQQMEKSRNIFENKIQKYK